MLKPLELLTIHSSSSYTIIDFPWIASVIVIVVLLVVSVRIVAIIVPTSYCYHKRRNRFNPNLHHVYEDPKPNLRTKGNLAYGHVQQSTELEGVIYEEPDGIKPEPQTQGNMAYGHVQFRQ